MYTKDIQTVNMDGITDFERIDAILRSLIVSIQGTIPGSRGFGLYSASTDLMPEAARNTFFMELDRAVEKYLPEIRIMEVLPMEEGDMTALRIVVGGRNT